MHARENVRETEQAASRDRETDRWLAVSEPLAVDDDPGWPEPTEEISLYERAA